MAGKTDKLLGQLRLDLEHMREGIRIYHDVLGDIAAAEDEITTLLNELQTLNDEQERLKAAAEEATVRLRARAADARALRTRLRYSLRGKLGPHSAFPIPHSAFHCTIRPGKVSHF